MWCGAVEFETHKSWSKEVIPDPTSGDKNCLIVFMLREKPIPVSSSQFTQRKYTAASITATLLSYSFWSKDVWQEEQVATWWNKDVNDNS